MEKITKKQIYTDLLPAFFLPMLIFLLILFRNQIVPFGETTLLYSDLDSQYIEFMDEYRRVLLGQGSFFWSWHAGLGMNFFAIIAYYLASPFNLLLALFPENQLPLAVTVITALKLGFIGAAFALHLQRHYKTRGTHVVLCAICYALCAYSVGYAFNIMWLDAMIWMPMLCTGIDRLLDSEKRGMTKLILFFFPFLSQSVLYVLDDRRFLGSLPVDGTDQSERLFSELSEEHTAVWYLCRDRSRAFRFFAAANLFCAQKQHGTAWTKHPDRDQFFFLPHNPEALY